jgi:hypothetical protein
VTPVKGQVLVRTPRAPSFVLLNTRQTIPLGSTIDTSKGRVRLVSAASTQGKIQSGVFNGGAFVVTQDRSATTDLRLVGGKSRRVCAKAGSGATGFAASLSSTVLQTLHGHAHGRFRTTGRYGSATVRGTDWTTVDRCSGTQIIANAGNVATQAVGAPLVFSIAPGITVEYRCAASGLAPVSTGYCVAVLATGIQTLVSGQMVNEVFYGQGVITKSTERQTDFCVTGPQGRTSCTAFPLSPPDRFGYEEGLATCVPDQGLGSYSLSFRIGGVTLGSPLPYQERLHPTVTLPCLSDVGKPQVGGLLSVAPPDVKHVNRYTLPTGALATRIGIYLSPTPTSGTQVIRGVVYADFGGAPGMLLGTTNELAFQSSDPAGWYFLTFPTSLELPAGDYWIGEITGAQSGVTAIAYDSVPASGDYNANPYTAGPTDPFGPLSTDDLQTSAYLEYHVASVP